MMKKIIAIVFLFLLNTVKAQEFFTIKNVSKKALKSYTEAKSMLNAGNETACEKMLLKSIQNEPKFLDAYIQLGNFYFRKKEYNNAISKYQKALELSGNYDARLPFYIAESYYLNLDFANAENYLNQIRISEIKSELILQNISNYKSGIELSKKQPRFTFEPINMGDSINTKDIDFFPAFSADDSIMVFARRIDGKNEDIYISKKNKEGLWSKAQSIDKSINTANNEGALCLSADGKKLYFTACDLPDGKGRCDIYFSKNESGKWSKPINLGEPVNTAHWESQPRLSANGTTLYFSSSRPGGFGGLDIWYSLLKPDGTWSEAKNMGENINSKGNEESPYIHFDNQTFYFDSDGLNGFGKKDLYVSKRNIYGKWEKAENIGFPLNTPENEASLIVSQNGRKAFIASERKDSKGLLDLYMFDLPENAKAIPVAFVKGKVFDAETKLPLQANLVLKSLENSKTIANINSNEDGSYLVCIPVGKDYSFHVNNEKYLFQSVNFSLLNHNVTEAYYQDIFLNKIEKEKQIVLRNIFFDVNKFELKPESNVELELILKMLIENPSISIEISGHTDDTGSEENNLKLSENRANAVMQYLIQKNIKSDRLKAIGFGETKPLQSNNTEEGKAINRRTEIKIL